MQPFHRENGALSSSMPAWQTARLVRSMSNASAPGGVWHWKANTDSPTNPTAKSRSSGHIEDMRGEIAIGFDY